MAQIGVKFPTREIGNDRGVIRDWALAAEQAGYRHICLIDHVLSVDDKAPPDWSRHWPSNAKVRRPYTIDDPFHEVFVMMGFFAALTSLELSTGILVVPQRQTALVAKQAAEVDILTAGRLRLVGAVGWNPVEYEGLGQDFGTRGRRFDEQIRLLRAFWTEPTVSFDGEFDQVQGAGLAPMPIQRPIPFWVGGFSPRTIRRVGELADGWLGGRDVEAGRRGIDAARSVADACGRSGAAIGLEATLGIAYEAKDDDLETSHARWVEAGATHLTVDTMGAGLRGAQHLGALSRLAERLPVRD